MYNSIYANAYASTRVSSTTLSLSLSVLASYLVLNRKSKSSEGAIAFAELKNVADKLPGSGLDQGAANALKLIAKLPKVQAIYKPISL